MFPVLLAGLRIQIKKKIKSNSLESLKIRISDTGNIFFRALNFRLLQTVMKKEKKTKASHLFFFDVKFVLGSVHSAVGSLIIRILPSVLLALSPVDPGQEPEPVVHLLQCVASDDLGQHHAVWLVGLPATHLYLV
jgi:hypothetical protein